MVVSAPVRWIDVVMLVGYAVALSAGQLLFKQASMAVQGVGVSELVRRLAASPTFVAALVLYALLTLVWTWILARVPLSYAYPFVALCFVLVPAAAWVLWGERFGVGYAAGLVLIVAGLAVIGLSQGR